MNHHTHKLCGTLAKKSLKCSELMANYDAEFENLLKKELYEEAKYVHRHQNGIIKVTRLCVRPAKNIGEILFEKTVPEIKTAAGFYDPLQDSCSESRYVWFMNHADSRLFNSYSGDGLSTDDMQVLQMPLLASLESYMTTNRDEKLQAKTISQGLPTPFLFEGIPFWISIDYDKLRKNGMVIRSMYRQDEKFLRQGFKVYQADFRTNLISMKAPHGGSGLYSKVQIENLLATLVIGLSGLVKQTAIKKAGSCALHTGNWGAGNFGGNLELMYLSQMYAASVCGVNELIFHAIKKDIFEKAMEKYLEIPQKLTFSEAVSYFKNLNYIWPE